MVGLHEAEIEHRHQRLPAGQKLGVVEAAEQRDGVGDRARIVIAKGGGFIRCIEPDEADFFTYTNNYASIQK